MRHEQLNMRNRWFAGILLGVYLPLLVALVSHTHTDYYSTVSSVGHETTLSVKCDTLSVYDNPANCPFCCFLHVTYLSSSQQTVEAAPVLRLPDVFFPYYFVVLPAALPLHTPRAPPVFGLV